MRITAVIDFIVSLLACAVFGASGYIIGWNRAWGQAGPMAKTAYQTGILDTIEFVMRNGRDYPKFTALEIGEIALQALVEARRGR